MSFCSGLIYVFYHKAPYRQVRAVSVIVHLLVKLGYNVGGNPFLREEERCGYSFVCPQ